ncbi:MAG TPA: hypothetical protein PL137_06710, partial [Nocardioides sp.]|nr:hypothetical protein [Nocardioides sp.]
MRQRPQRLRLAVGDAEPVASVVGAEQRRTEAEGDREPAGSKADGLSGVVGRHVGRAFHWPDRTGRLAGRHPLGRLGPALQQRDQRLAIVGGDIEGGEVQSVLGRGDDAGLVLAAERVRRHRGARRIGRGSVAGAADRERADDPGSGHAAADEAAPGDSPARRVVLLAHASDFPRLSTKFRTLTPSGQESTDAVSCESGSESALTA